MHGAMIQNGGRLVEGTKEERRQLNVKYNKTKKSKKEKIKSSRRKSNHQEENQIIKKKIKSSRRKIKSSRRKITTVLASQIFEMLTFTYLR
jgi:3'-phosphoadenosine 5'-phosphosulfate (PAPS) 3'-phosphatase